MADSTADDDFPRQAKRRKTATTLGASGFDAQFDQNDPKLSAFIHWCLYEPSPFRISKKVRVGKTGSCAGHGMSAVDDISTGEELFCIAQSRIISWETMLDNRDDEQRIAIEEMAVKSRWAPLILCIMVEMNKANSLWHPYLDLFLQDSEMDLPLFWDESFKELLGGTYIRDRIAKDRNQIEKDFSQLIFPCLVKYHHTSQSSYEPMLEAAFRICGFIMSYSFTRPDSGTAPLSPVDEENSESGDDDEATTAGNALAEVPMMVPLADLLNASISKNNANLHWGEEEGDPLRMIATKDIKAGEEVFNTYGEISNEEMLYLYGYAENDENNPYEEVFIRCQHVYEVCKEMIEQKELPLAIDAMDSRWQLLKNRRMVGEDLPLVLGRKEVLTDIELRTIVDVFKMDEEEFAAYSENVEEEDEIEEPTFTLENLRILDPVVRAIFLRVIRRKIEEYPRNLPEEKEYVQSCLVENPSNIFSKRERWCSFVRHAQLLLLDQYSRALQ